MLENGASRIHRLDEIAEDLSDIATYTQFDEAIKLLHQADFLVITGVEESVFFARDPLLAHTLGISMRHRREIEATRGYFASDPNAEQFMLKFKGAKDPEFDGHI
jgi:hypothetical protein